MFGLPITIPHNGAFEFHFRDGPCGGQVSSSDGLTPSEIADAVEYWALSEQGTVRREFEVRSSICAPEPAMAGSLEGVGCDSRPTQPHHPIYRTVGTIETKSRVIVLCDWCVQRNSKLRAASLVLRRKSTL
jgi:hypothetical protein